MWKTGVCSISFRKHSIEEIVRAAAEAGLDGIEWGSDVHVPSGDTEMALKARAVTEKAGLQCLSYGGYYRLGCGTQEEFEGLLACAEAMGVRDVRIWGGKKGSTELNGEDWAALVSEAKDCADKAQARGMVLSLECHNWTLTDEWHTAKKFIDEVNSPALRMYWQPNQYRSEEYDLEALTELVGTVTNVHVFSWGYMDLSEQNPELVRLPLADHSDMWARRLNILEEQLRADEEHSFILEFMHDDNIETLKETAAVLNGWLKEHGLRG